ncbi:MAG: efflux RND transporter periplasmic adaptor subunit [Holosporaceae bacterium]|nr:efflux RND transporter periplasmic adaptor subunit [Holosporaceae bacterium]
MLIKNKYATAVVAVILLCTAAFWLFSGGGFKSARKKSAKSPANVTVTVIAPSMEKTFLKSIGTAVSNESVDIMSCVSQTVASVHFSDCEYVKKGQLLVQLNTERKTAEKKQAEINLLEQQREFFRMETLRKKKIIPEKDYDVQKTKMLDAQAKLDAINADINQSSITAPFDGVLGIRKVSVGALLTQGSVITTIDDVSKMKVDFTVPEKYILLLKPQLKITAKSLALKGKKFKGDILAVVPRVSAVSRNVSV